MSRICLVDSGSCARASRSLQMHRGYWHYPWYFDTKLPYKYVPIVILHISTERILGSGSCKTSCTKLKKVKNFTRATPLRSKTPNVVQRDMQIRVALRSSFGPKLIWADTGAPPRPNSEILPHHTVWYLGAPSVKKSLLAPYKRYPLRLNIKLNIKLLPRILSSCSRIHSLNVLHAA